VFSVVHACLQHPGAAKLQAYAERRPDTPELGKGYYELACAMRFHHDLDRPFAAGIFKKAMPLLTDAADRADSQ